MAVALVPIVASQQSYRIERKDSNDLAKLANVYHPRLNGADFNTQASRFTFGTVSHTSNYFHTPLQQPGQELPGYYRSRLNLRSLTHRKFFQTLILL